MIDDNDEKIEHTGFCLADYDVETCKECPCEEECLELYREEKAKKARNDD